MAGDVLLIHKSGCVKTPYKYRNWYAEICGDTNDTGGFHLLLAKATEQNNVEGYNYLHFWDVTEKAVYKQLQELYIEIEWNDKGE